MRKLKIPVWLLLTLVFLILFALLPMLVSAALDIRLGQTSSYCDMLSVQLNMGTKEQQLSSLDKLALISIAETTNASQDQMTMSESEVYDCVYSFMRQCEIAGIFQPFEPSTVTIQPKLSYDLSDPSKHILVWSVTMLYKGEPNQVLRMDVDDETGQILSITYGNYQEYTMDGVWERNKTVVDAIADIYFTQLGIYEVAEEIENYATDTGSYKYAEIDGGVTEALYVFTDPLFGKFFAQFTVDGAGGFSISLYK